MTDKDLYLQFCEKEKEIPIFSQPWYLDAICGSNNWDILMVKKGNEIAATMPVIRKKQYGFLMRRMPLITSYLGPFFPHKFRSNKQQEKLTAALISQIPKYDFFEQNLHPTIINSLPYFWEGFQTSVFYTFMIDLEQHLEDIYNNISSNYRNNKIGSAQKKLQVTNEGSIEDFYEIMKRTFQRQKIRIPYSMDFLKQYDNQIAQKQCGKKFFAKDRNDEIHAVAYLIWDKKTSYFQLAGNDPNLRNSGAGILLIWEAIQFSKKTLGKKRFDFAGSIIQPITKVRLAFGAKQIPYYNVKKINSPILNALYRLK